MPHKHQEQQKPCLLLVRDNATMQPTSEKFRLMQEATPQTTRADMLLRCHMHMAQPYGCDTTVCKQACSDYASAMQVRLANHQPPLALLRPAEHSLHHYTSNFASQQHACTCYANTNHASTAFEQQAFIHRCTAA